MLTRFHFIFKYISVTGSSTRFRYLALSPEAEVLLLSMNL